jgi:hypothetical protein
MAQRIAVELIDDLDGSEATETVPFGIGGSTYEIDLTDDHGDDLGTVLEPYVTHARVTVGRKRRRLAAGPRTIRVSVIPAVQAPAPSSDPAVIRRWPASNGVRVSTRGRISASVLAQYLAAQERGGYLAASRRTLLRAARGPSPR